MTISTGLPNRPPASLISSIAMRAALPTLSPDSAPRPENGPTMPTLTGLAIVCALASPIACRPISASPRNNPVLVRVMGSSLLSFAEIGAAHLLVLGERRRGALHDD